MQLYGSIFNLETTACQCPVGFKWHEQEITPGNDVTRKHASTVCAQQCWTVVAVIDADLVVAARSIELDIEVDELETNNLHIE